MNDKTKVNPNPHHYNYKSMLKAMQSCNEEWVEKHGDAITALILEHLPHGSGIDCDWEISINNSEENAKIECYNSFHTMDEYGYYGGYVDFTIIIPLEGNWYIECDDEDEDNDGLKDYLEQVIDYSMSELENKFLFATYHYYNLNERFQLAEEGGE